MIIDRASGAEDTTRLSTLAWKWLPVLIIAAGLVRLVLFVREPWELVQPIVAITIAILVLAGLGLYEPVSPLPRDRYVPLLWPATMILIGIWLAVAPLAPRVAASEGSDELRIAIWLRGEAHERSAPFVSGRILVILGYLQLDLRGSSAADRSRNLDLTVLLGHVRILVPSDAAVFEHPAFVLTRRGLQYRNPAILPEDQTLLRITVVGVGGGALVIKETTSR
jgi:hypothetical protein